MQDRIALMVDFYLHVRHEYTNASADDEEELDKTPTNQKEVDKREQII